MSWHHGDWLSFAQALTALLAVLTAIGVIFLQNHLGSKAAREAEIRKLIRDRYRSATYAHAVVSNAVDVAEETVNGVADIAARHDVLGNLRLETGRLDDCTQALSNALHQPLPSELIQPIYTAWGQAQQLARAAHRTKRGDDMKTDALLAYCLDRRKHLMESQATIAASKDKWFSDLNELGSLADSRRK